MAVVLEDVLSFRELVMFSCCWLLPFEEPDKLSVEDLPLLYYLVYLVITSAPAVRIFSILYSVSLCVVKFVFRA